MTNKRLTQFRGITSNYKRLVRDIITTVQVGLPYEAGREKGQPSDRKLLALWDTGATGSVISEELAIQLNLPAIGQTEVAGIGGSYAATIYLASIFLPNKIVIPEQELLSSNDHPNTPIIIGMDIIIRGDFLLSNPASGTIFSFQIPSIGELSLDMIKVKRPRP